MGSIDPTLDGMVIDSLSEPRTSENRSPSVASIIPSGLQDIMEKLTQVMRDGLGKEGLLNSTSDINAPIDHGLPRGVLRELHAQYIKFPEDVGAVISAIENYINNGLVGDENHVVH